MINDYFKYKLYRKYETSDGVTFTPLDEYQAYNEVALPNKDCGFEYDGMLVLNNAKHTIIKKGDSLSKLYYVEGDTFIDTNVTGEIKGTTLEGNQNSTYYISMTPNYASYSHLFDDTNYHDSTYDLKSIYIDFNGIDTSSLTDMSYMFNNCQDVESIILKNIDTSNVTDMSYMFYMFYYAHINTLDISSFDTSKVTNMSNMFYNFGIHILDLSHFNTENVTNMNDMFNNCGIGTLNLSNFNFLKASTNAMFLFSSVQNLIAKNCIVNEDFPPLNATNPDYFDVSNISIKSSKYFRPFNGIKYLKTAICHGLNQTNCPMLSSFNSAFRGENIEHIELTDINLPLLTDVSFMFYKCPELTYIEITGIDVSKIEKYDEMFYRTEKVNHIKCNIEFKEWCLQHQNEISLPSEMREEGFGTWEIV